VFEDKLKLDDGKEETCVPVAMKNGPTLVKGGRDRVKVRGTTLKRIRNSRKEVVLLLGVLAKTSQLLTLKQIILCTITKISTAGDSTKEMSAHVTKRTTQVTATSNTFFLFTDNSSGRLHK
jgi:hypothetical protein